ncbi:STAS domain-containing protein [Krasilnikovia sp. MM14-A1259]|uniref:STAS domain-containing protein n=1 Tax=Krasilnikovia sp. MM14-A1259 TaxID=3373539 RepID=UPI00399D0550
MTALGCMVQQIGGRLLVRLSGELSVSTVPQVRAELLKALAEQPDAVVADLSDLVVREPYAVSVFAAVVREAAMWPDTPLLVCVPDRETARLLTRRGDGRVPVFESVEQALSVPARRRMTLICDTLLPVADSACRARQLATEACARWGLPHLIGPARLIAGELATNAAVHAGTFAAVRFMIARHFLLISMRDGSPVEPRLGWAPPEDPGAGRGLLLVDATAHRWGWHVRDDGKVVWASLRTRKTATG